MKCSKQASSLLTMRSLTAGQRSGRREKTEMRGEGEDWIREGKQRFSILLFLSLQLAVFSHTQAPAIFLPWECIWLQKSSLSYVQTHCSLYLLSFPSLCGTISCTNVLLNSAKVQGCPLLKYCIISEQIE